MRTVSVGVKLQQLHGIVGTAALGEWATKFVNENFTRTGGGKDTRSLTSKQVEKIDDLYGEHFT